MTTEEWLIKEGYPLTMPMTRDNLARIIDRYKNEAIVKKDEEINRLKLLIGYAHQIGFSRGGTENTTIEASWNKFKTENNL